MGKKADIVRQIERDGCIGIFCGACPLRHYGGSSSHCAAYELKSLNFNTAAIRAQATEWLAKRAERKAKKRNASDESKWDGKFVPGRWYINNRDDLIYCIGYDPESYFQVKAVPRQNIGEYAGTWFNPGSNRLRPATAADLIRAGMITE